MTLEIRSQVKDHRRYDLENLREDVKLFQGFAQQVSLRSADTFPSYTRETRGGIASVQAVSRWKGKTGHSAPLSGGRWAARIVIGRCEVT